MLGRGNVYFYFSDMENSRLLFPPGGMPCPEAACDTTTYTRYQGLVQHWKTVHNPVIEVYKCQVCKKSFRRRPDANRHLRNCHGTGVETCHHPNRDFIPPHGMIPRKPPAVINTQLSDSQPRSTTRNEAREAARIQRQHVRDEALRGPLVAMVNKEWENTLPCDRGDLSNFTLCSPEEDLDYE